MLRTRLCELLEIEVPVVGAPIGPEIAGLDLAAAVSNAGGAERTAIRPKSRR